MDKLIPQYYTEYGKYVNNEKMFPDIRDGLIPVQRRTILAAYTIARNNFVKTPKILGEIIGKWHPHAEQLGTVEWAVQNKFMEGAGWWGTRLGSDTSKCAAARYTNAKLSNFSYDLALKYVKHVEWKSFELDPEPVAFPTMLPFALICKYTQSFVGFGRRTVLPTYTPEDLISRLFDKNKIIKPTIIGAVCVSSDKECEKLLTTNDKPITLYFKLKTFIDNKNKAVYILSSPEFQFKNIVKKLGTLWEKEDISFIELPTPKQIRSRLNCTEDETVCFKFTPNRVRDVDKIFNAMVEKIKKIKFPIHYEPIAYDNTIDNIKQVSVDEFINSSYNFFLSTFKNYINYEIDRNKRLLFELEIIIAIQPYIGKYMKLKKDIDTIVSELSNKTGYSVKDINIVIQKYNIKSILNMKNDKSKYTDEIAKLENQKANVKNTVKKLYVAFLNKLK